MLFRIILEQRGDVILHIGLILYNQIMKVPVICTMVYGDNEIQEFFKRVKKAVIYSFIDTVIVGGIAFFSSIVAIGYDDLLVNVKVAFISSVVTAGLAFFTEMRNKIEINNKVNNNPYDKT